MWDHSKRRQVSELDDSIAQAIKQYSLEFRELLENLSKDPQTTSFYRRTMIGASSPILRRVAGYMTYFSMKMAAKRSTEAEIRLMQMADGFSRLTEVPQEQDEPPSEYVIRCLSIYLDRAQEQQSRIRNTLLTVRRFKQRYKKLCQENQRLKRRVQELSNG